MSSEKLFDLYSELHGAFSSSDNNMKRITRLKKSIKSAELDAGVKPTFKFVDKERKAIEINIPVSNLRRVEIPVFLYESHRPVFSQVYIQKGKLGGYWENVQLDMKPNKTEDHARPVFGKLLYDLISAVKESETSADFSRSPMEKLRPEKDVGAPEKKEEIKGFPNLESRLRKAGIKPYNFVNTRVEGGFFKKNADKYELQYGNAPIPSKLAQAMLPLRFDRLAWAENLFGFLKRHEIDISASAYVILQEECASEQAKINHAFQEIEDNIVYVYGGNIEKARQFIHTVNAELRRFDEELGYYYDTAKDQLKTEGGVARFYKHVQFLLTHALQCIIQEFDLEGIMKMHGVVMTSDEKIARLCQLKILYVKMSLAKNHRPKIITLFRSVMEKINSEFKSNVALYSNKSNRKRVYASYTDTLKKRSVEIESLMRKRMMTDNEYKNNIGLRGKEQVQYAQRLFESMVKDKNNAALYILHKMKFDLKVVAHALYKDTPLYEDMLSAYDEIELAYQKSKTSTMSVEQGGLRSFVYFMMLIHFVLIFMLMFNEGDSTMDEETKARLFAAANEKLGEKYEQFEQYEQGKVATAAVTGAITGALIPSVAPYFCIPALLNPAFVPPALMALSPPLALGTLGFSMFGLGMYFFNQISRNENLLSVSHEIRDDFGQLVEYVRELDPHILKQADIGAISPSRENLIHFSVLARHARAILDPILNNYSVEINKQNTKSVNLKYDMLVEFNVVYQTYANELYRGVKFDARRYEEVKSELRELALEDIKSYFEVIEETPKHEYEVIDPVYVSSVLAKEFADTISNEAVDSLKSGAAISQWKEVFDKYDVSIKTPYYTGHHDFYSERASDAADSLQFISSDKYPDLPSMSLTEAKRLLEGEDIQLMSTPYLDFLEYTGTARRVESQLADTSSAIIYATTHGYGLPNNSYLTMFGPFVSAVTDTTIRTFGRLDEVSVTDPARVITNTFKIAAQGVRGFSANLAGDSIMQLSLPQQAYGIAADNLDYGYRYVQRFGQNIVSNLRGEELADPDPDIPDEKSDSGLDVLGIVQVANSWTGVFTDAYAHVGHNVAILATGALFSGVAATCVGVGTVVKEVYLGEEYIGEEKETKEEEKEVKKERESGCEGLLLDEYKPSKRKKKPAKIKQKIQDGIWGSLWRSFARKIGPSRLRTGINVLMYSTWGLSAGMIYFIIPACFDFHYTWRFLTARAIFLGIAPAVSRIASGAYKKIKKEDPTAKGERDVYEDLFSIATPHLIGLAVTGYLGGSTVEYLAVGLSLLARLGLLAVDYNEKKMDSFLERTIPYLGKLTYKSVIRSILLLPVPSRWGEILLGKDNTFMKPELLFTSEYINRFTAKMYGQKIDVIPPDFGPFLLELPDVWDKKNKKLTEKAIGDLLRVYKTTMTTLLFMHLTLNAGGKWGVGMKWGILSHLLIGPDDDPLWRAFVLNLRTIYGSPSRQFLAYAKFARLLKQ